MPKTKDSSILYLLLLTALAAAAFSGNAGETVKGELGAKLDEYLTRITPFGFSGALLAARGDEIIINKGYGLAIRANGTPNSADTIFCLGSITKQFTAAAVMTLEMQGKLKTSDPISLYLDGVPKDKAGITLHHLLTHTSGLVPDVGGDYEAALRDETVRKILALPLEFNPGERFAYSNVNYSLLAAIIEKVSGMSYEEYLHQYLFEPAGMEWTGYKIPKWDKRLVAHWYVGEADNSNSLTRPFPYWNLLGNGGILSTTGDMFKWHQALLGDKILSAEAKKKLFTPFLNDYAYGWDVLKTERGLLIQHNGGSGLGNNAEIRRYMDAGIVTIIFCNQFYNGRPLIDAVRGKIESLVFGKDVPLPPEVTGQDKAILKKFEGIYELPAGGRLNIKLEDNALKVRAEGQDAVNALSFPEGGDVAGLIRIGQQSAQILEAALKGNYGPFAKMMANKEKRLERVREFIESRIKESQGRTGTIQQVKAMSTLPSAFEEGAVESQVQLKGERGSIFFRLIWKEDKNIGIGPLEIVAPAGFIFQPLSEYEFAGYDLAAAKNVRMSFDLDNQGAVKRLILQGKEKNIEAKKIF
jgi:CubicO group peptidase (beta-lactamase class C family)